MIVAKNIRKSYKDFTLDVNFRIPKGRITGIVGKNGAGKTTIIKLILGLVFPNEGEIMVIGSDINKFSAKEKEQLGVVLAESGFCTYLKLSDIIKILKKSYSNFDENRFKELCNKMNLPFDKPIEKFSTGMKAKLKLLVAMSHNAKLLILDEPTAGFDVETRNKVLDIIRQYMEEDENRTVLITSHISSDLESICDDIYLIHNGKIIAHEDTDIILGEYGIIKVDEKTYLSMDKSHLLRTKKTSYGYLCFTKEKRYYQENYPKIVIENGSIDEMILMLTGGEN